LFVSQSIKHNNFYLKSNLEQGSILINHMTQTTSDDLLRARFPAKNSNKMYFNKRYSMLHNL